MLRNVMFSFIRMFLHCCPKYRIKPNQLETNEILELDHVPRHVL